MSERRVYLAIILFILAAVLAVTVFYAVRYMDFFAIDRITVTGMDQVPHSVSRILVSCHGLNRFRVDVDEMEEAVPTSSAFFRRSRTTSYSPPS